MPSRPEIVLLNAPTVRQHRTRPPGLLLVITGFGALLAASWTIYALLWFIEFGGRPGSVGLIELWSSPRAAEVLSGIGEVTVAVLAIALTVVAILVELASSRFTARIGPLFIRDPVNALVLGGFVVTVVLVLWVDMSLYGPDYPETMVLAATGALSLAVLGLLPYFGYLFGFFSPSNVIGRVQRQAVRAIRRAARSGASVDRRRERVIGNVEHLADMILIAIKNDESALAVPAIEALSELARSQLALKRDLPAAWFGVESLAETDRDFVTLDPEMMGSLDQASDLAGGEDPPRVPDGLLPRTAQRPGSEPPDLDPHPSHRLRGAPGGRSSGAPPGPPLPQHRPQQEHHGSGTCGPPRTCWPSSGASPARC